MEKTEIKNKVVEVVVDKLCVDKEDVLDETKFVEDLGCDSIDLVELCMGFEKVFSIRIDDDDFEKVVTVNDAVGVIADVLDKH